MATSVAPLKSKKKSQVIPLETEMDDLGAPPSSSDLRELFDTSVEDRPPSSILAFTEDTGLDDSRSNMQSQDIDKDNDEGSSRSSTPSSITGLTRKKKKNVVEPIKEEETSFSAENSKLSIMGRENPMYESDNNLPKSMEAWSNAGSTTNLGRPNTAPTDNKPGNMDSPRRPQTAPSSSPRLFQRSNKVTPLSSSTSLQNKLTVQADEETEIKEFEDSRVVSPLEFKKDEQYKSKINSQDVEDLTFEEQSENEEKTDESEKCHEDKMQIIEEAILAPPQSSGEHQAYVPMDYAKECIQKVIEDMKKMKANHFQVVEKIQEQYQLIEEESQAQFNAYVIKLRGEYSTKVATIRHVLEAHQTDFKQKQQFYEEAIKSLREKNRSLLIEKRNYLLKAKDQNAKNENEKNQILCDLTNMLDQKHKEYVSLRQRLVDERARSDKAEKENSELRSQLDGLNAKLSLASGESSNLVGEIDNLNNENTNLKKDLQDLQEQYQKLKEADNEKTDTIEANEKLIEDLQEKIKELENRPANIVHVQAENIESSLPPVEKAEVDALREQIQEKQNTIEELKSDSEEKEKNFKEMYEELKEEMKRLRNEKNTLKMELINLQEKNAILHKRLETMLNEVMDSVDNDQLLVKLSELKEKKSGLQDEIDEEEKEIEKWREDFISEMGREPTEDDRPHEIASIYEKLKKANEEMVTIDKDMTVLSMLIDGTLPDDMKQQGDVAVANDSSEELKKQFEVEKEELQNDIEKFKEKIAQQEAEINDMKEKINDLESRQPETVYETVAVKSDVDGGHPGDSEALSKLQQELAETLQRMEEIEKEYSEELETQKKHAHKVDKKLSKLQHAHENLEGEKRDLESQLKVAKESNEAEVNLKQEKLDQLQKEIEELNEAKLSKLPVKAKTEIKALQEKLKQLEEHKDGSSQELIDLKTKNSEMSEQIANMIVTINSLKEKQDELEKLQETDRKYKELKKKYKALEAKKTITKTMPSAPAGNSDAGEIKKLQKKIAELEKQLESGGAKKDAKEPKLDPKAMNKLEKSNEMLKEKVESMKNAAKVDADKIKELQEKLKEAKAKGDDKNAKKQEKAMKDLQKKLEAEEKKAAKLKENLDNTKEEINELNKELEELKSDSKKDKAEIAKLGVAAKEGLEAIEKVDELKKSNKELSAENKTLAENFNSERILRKKYYNMVEDMKGKIRVYARARPLSRSELDRGNHSIISSPDEYSLIIQTQRGPKDFQYDAVFTPDDNQEKVFEDTNNLIQSAVDGYNVCIFAYGQTGSGKTFTMIGDKEQKFPGIAPRSFKAIYGLIEENKSKFSFKTSMYMMELYRDNLIDLFGNAKNPAKLDIKKDKKGMVVVIGSVVKEANSAEELMSLFEEGSASRHIASTKMNAESSRSHLVLSIIIESTNLTSGAVTKGKLSLVDLAGSERAAKTGATAEQLKEAQSINKSLSALGDVISALSSEQSFIPYRNNKLTMLMQDSLGGNAKTLMFVNISPADYNADETITSLTYASRVKLITNDASKNADNKEISRLKGIIAKLKKGESVDDEEDI